MCLGFFFFLRTLDRDATLFADDLTIASLQQVLAERGIPHSETKSMCKAEQVAKTETAQHLQHRIAKALDRREAALLLLQKKRTHCAFSRLGTALVVALSAFIDLPSMGRLSCVCRFLRVRLTLSLTGTPSPGMAALRRLDIGEACPQPGWVLEKALPRCQRNDINEFRQNHPT